MAHNRRLITDEDFNEAMERQAPIRVFENDHIVDAGGHVIRFDDSLVVIQSGVSDLKYHRRELCEFFEMRKR